MRSGRLLLESLVAGTARLPSVTVDQPLRQCNRHFLPDMIRKNVRPLKKDKASSELLQARVFERIKQAQALFPRSCVKGVRQPFVGVRNEGIVDLLFDMRPRIAFICALLGRGYEPLAIFRVGTEREHSTVKLLLPHCFRSSYVGRRSLCGKSRAESEQWDCWIGHRRIISASAENRGNSCRRKHHPAEILALGPSCASHRRSSNANSLGGQNLAGSPEICATFQRDILPRHF